MKRFYTNYLFILLLLSCFTTLQAQSDVTFSVDMSGVEVSPSGVNVAFAASTASTLSDVLIGALVDGDGDGIYSNTLSFKAG